MRKFWSLIIGVVVAIILVFVFEMISHLIYPPPAGLNYTDKNELIEYMKVVPVGALVLVAVGHFLALTAGNVTGLLIINGDKRIAYGITVAFLGLVIMNLSMVPHPSWFMAAELLAIALALFVSLKLIKPK